MTSDPTTRPAAQRRSGFTLVELMVVIALISVATALALPSIMHLFNSGADAQAYNLVGAQLTAARAIAIRNHTYAGVHVQLGDARDASNNPIWPKLTGTCFSAIVVRDRKSGLFRVQGQPQKVPGSYAFGKIDSATVSGSSYSATDPVAFCNFTVVFTPGGDLAKRVDNGQVQFDSNEPIFHTDPNATNVTGQSKLWELPAAAEGVLALTMFNYTEYILLSGSNRTNYLNSYAQFLPVNAHTGQIYRKE